MIALGLDIGTTSVCGVLFDAQSGTCLQALTLQNDSFLTDRAAFERVQDVQKIVCRVDELLTRLYREDVGVIGVTGQMHGILYLDREGQPLSPLYTWQDGRGNLQDANGVRYADRLRGASGFGTVTDLYNAEHALVPQEAAVFCTIHDYIAMRLAGQKTPLVHTSDAASLGAYDAREHAFTIENARLPRVTKHFDIIGSYRNTPVCVAIGDNQASFLSAAGDDCMLINVGTGSQVSIPVKGYHEALGLETRPLNGDDYILVGSSLCGGRAFAILEHFFADVVQMATGSAPDSLYAQMDAVLREDIQTSVKMDTRFSGTRQDPTVCGSITGLREDNFRAADLLVAAIDGMSRELHDMYRASGVRVKRITGSGNGLRRNPALRRVTEKMFGMPLRFPAHREEAAVGAAMSALCAVGEYRDLRDLAAHISFEV